MCVQIYNMSRASTANQAPRFLAEYSGNED